MMNLAILKKILPPFLLLFLFTTLVTTPVYSVEETVSIRKSGLDILNTQNLTTTIFTHYNNISLEDPSVKEIKSVIEFGIDENVILQDTYYKYKIIFDLSYTELDGSSLVNVSEYDKELIIDYDPANPYIDRAVYRFPNGVRTRLYNIRLYKWNGSTFLTSTVDRENLYVETRIESEYYWEFDQDAVPSTTGFSISSVSNGYNVNFPFLDGAEYYDVEWTWVHRYQGTMSLGEPVLLSSMDVNFDFKQNASLIRTQQNTYHIPNIYGNGFLLVRYRGVGIGGASLDVPLEGRWMYESVTSGAVNDFHSNAYVTTIPIEDNTMNYQASMSFVEGGKKFTQLNYMDGVLKPRQSISQINSQEKVLVGSVIYDHYGRPAINVMNSPVDQNTLHYIEDLNLNLTGDVYSKDDFDQDVLMIDDCGPKNAPAMSESLSTGSANYYSDQNPDKDGANAYIPDGNGYTFVQVQYANDPTGRILRAGGVGEAYQLNNTTGHYTEEFYSIVSQTELDQLFGSEADFNQNYTKIVNRDVHGQFTVTIVDVFGRVIASYLEGPAPDEFLAVAGNNPGSPEVEFIDLMEFDGSTDDDLANGLLRVETKITVTDTQDPYLLTYDFTAENYTNSCLPEPMCFDCHYILTIKIERTDGFDCVLLDDMDEPIEGGYIVVPLGTLEVYDSLCDGPFVFSNAHASEGSFEVHFPSPGEYQITKTLQVDQNPAEFYWDLYVNNAADTCLLPFTYFLEQELSSIDFSLCTEISPCELQFINTHGILSIYLANNPEDDEEDYYALKAEFLFDCENQPLCSQLKPILLMDVSPGGQYGNTTGTDVLSVFHSTTDLAFKWDDLPGTDHYMEADGITESKIIVTENIYGIWEPAIKTGVTPVLNGTTGNYEVYPEELELLTDFAFTFWKDSWAEQLVKAHPEYYVYLFCEENPTVFEYETDFLHTQTYSEASTNGFLVPANTTTYSDCFSDGPTGTGTDPLLSLLTGLDELYYYDDDLDNTNDYSDVLAAYMDLCDGLSLYEKAAELAGDAVFGTSDCDVDLHWKYFKSLYLGRRNIILQIVMEGWALENYGGENRCIQYTDYTPCTSDYENKIKRFPLFDQIMPGSLVDYTDPTFTDDLVDEIEAGTMCEDMCASLVDLWMENLEGCQTPMGATLWEEGDATYDALAADLLYVCENGCTPISPFPSQYIADGFSPTPSYATSFQSVIEEHIISGGETLGCNHYLITLPSPAPAPVLASSMSQCACDQLMSVSTAEEFYDEYGYTPVEFCKDRSICAEIGSLDMGLTYAFETISWSSMELEEIESYFTVTTYSCNETEGCLTCEQLADFINDFETAFSGADWQVDYEMFTSYINEITGTGFNYYTINAFYENCLEGELQYTLTDAAIGLRDLLNLFVGGGASTNQTYYELPSFFDIPICLQSPTGPFVYEPTFVGGLEFNHNSYCRCWEDAITYPADLSFIPQSMAGHSTYQILMEHVISFINVTVNSTGVVIYTAQVLNSTGGLENVAFHLDSDASCLEFVTQSYYLCQNYVVPENETNDCIDALIANATLQAEEAYYAYLEEKKAEFIADYLGACNQVEELFTLERNVNRYHYTLFYYDRAGNLMRTVAPKGVNRITNTTDLADIADYRINPSTGAEIFPTHTYNTTYKYNSLDQVVEVNTPDGGTNHFWYDNLGRLVVSQSAKQADFENEVIAHPTIYAGVEEASAWSYSLYDDLGRIKEVGEQICSDPMTYAKAKDPTTLATWLGQTTDVSRNNVVITHYSDESNTDAIAEFGTQGYGDIRNRITRVEVYSGYMNPVMGDWEYETGAIDPNFQNHYSYDIHGNVSLFLQEIPALTAANHIYNQTEYKYDLLSGLPHETIFNKGKRDQLIHKYEYDADNRLKEVYTSQDDIIWDNDAAYFYREDGYMIRTELGEMKVQGMDFAFTLQGWLKSLNSGVLNPEKDMGKDGITGLHSSQQYLGSFADVHEFVARDAFAYSIVYHHDDFTPINTTKDFQVGLGTSGAGVYDEIKELYNGNIGAVITSMMDENNDLLDVTASVYRYDQLQRLKTSKVFSLSGTSTVSANSLASSTRKNIGVSITGMADYEVGISYDANGNITDLTRMASGSTDNEMDEFRYSYISNTNKLDHVEDGISSTGILGYGDIQHGQTSGNYTYYPDGSLKSDLQEEIGYIEWYPNGKIKEIHTLTSSHKPNVYFEYDPMGIRTLKVEKTKDGMGDLNPEEDWIYTWYGLDANGTTLAVYGQTENLAKIYAKELYIYGSKRLAVKNTNIDAHNPPDTTGYSKRELGKKYFELADYLGNVKEVISDRKLAIFDGGGDFEYFYADIVSFTDYYAFGMVMPNRSGNADFYRYGAANGQEKVDEISGEGNHYTARYWEYDSRLGRRWNVDPVVKYHESPYACFANNPIWFVDPHGADTIKAPNGKDYNVHENYYSIDGGNFLIGKDLPTKIWDGSIETANGNGGYRDLNESEMESHKDFIDYAQNFLSFAGRANTVTGIAVNKFMKEFDLIGREQWAKSKSLVPLAKRFTFNNIKSTNQLVNKVIKPSVNAGKSFGKYIPVAGFAIVIGDAAIDGEWKPSNTFDMYMNGIALIPAIGPALNVVYLVVDISLIMGTGKSVGDYINEVDWENYEYQNSSDPSHPVYIIMPTYSPGGIK